MILWSSLPWTAEAVVSFKNVLLSDKIQHFDSIQGRYQEGETTAAGVQHEVKTSVCSNYGEHHLPVSLCVCRSDVVKSQGSSPAKTVWLQINCVHWWRWLS